ncbi:hepatocyte growth factor receptor-like isoform X2 [Ornithodoros turicata]|uniref:hepatocyte growth factor receptor-like isoform X2 n=1 Tax=Ornithodoros turicata TaxID=34597 RepID=UPI00313A40BC
MAHLHRHIISAILITSFLSVTSSRLPSLTDVYRIDDGIPQNIVRLQRYTDIIIVGGRNALYKFTPDLNLTSQFFTGPYPDSLECRPDPLPCEQARILTDNDNKVLLQLRNLPFVLSCGSIWQGTCSLYTVSLNITKTKEFDKSLVVNYVASRAETVAFYGEGSHTDVLFSASTYDDRPVRYHPFPVAARTSKKDSLKLAADEGNTASFVDVVEAYKKPYKIHYIYGFAYDGFAYFVTVQNPGVSLTIFETRLARVCQKDLSFFTYTEVPLKCVDGERTYSVAEVATLHMSGGSTRKKKSESVDETATLSVAFGKPYSGMGFVNDPSLGSGLCQFKMTDVVAMFENTTTDCNNGGQAASLQRLLHGETLLRCQEYKPTGGVNFCAQGPNYYIESRLHLPGTLTITRKDSLMTSLLMLRQGEAPRQRNIAWIGDSNGHLSKYLIAGRTAKLLGSTDISQQEESTIPPRVRKSVAVDADGNFGYFLTGRSVVKFPVGSCSIYNDCASCMRASDDPLGCGWCDGRCAHQGECDTTVDTAQCPISIEKVYPTRGPVTGGTLLTIEGDNLGTQHEPDHSSIRVTVGDVVCPLFSWNFTTVQCTVPAAGNATSAGIRISVNDTYYSDDKLYDIMDTQLLEEPFQYLDVSIFGMYPTFGPMSGGTNLTIEGLNLDSGTNHVVRVGIYPCEILSLSNEAVTCETPNVTTAALTSSAMRVVYLVEDKEVLWSCGEQCIQNSFFKYSIDPVVESVVPKSAPFAGGTNITVRGTNLNSVYKPMLVFQGDENDGGNTISTQCLAMLGGSTMTCAVPSLYNSTIVNQARITKFNLRNSALLVHGYFQMDSLKLGSKPGQTSFDFLYRPDPEFETFTGEGNEVEVGLDDLTLEIPGKNLDSIIFRKDVNIKVGDVDFACNITDIQPTALFCSLRKDEFSEESEHSVEVILAGRSYSVGALRLVPAKVASHTGLIAAVVVVVFIVVVIVAGVLYYIKIRSKKTVPEYFVDYNNRGDDGNRANNYVRPNDAEAREALMAHAFELDSETIAMLESEKILFKREYLILGPVIGQGQFGCVYRGTLELEGKGEVLSVAVKTLHNNSRGVELDGQAFLEEALIMKDFHHTNVLSLIGLCVDTDGQLMVITPYMKYGDLLSYIRDERNSPTVKDLITYGIHIAEGMNYLSSQKFVHRDLAARNCMLSEDFTVHVADFGLSRDVYEKDYYSGDNKKTKLPVKWMAPESLEKGIYNHKTDVWAYGIVLWELMTRGVTPYPEVDNWDIVNFLKQGRRMQQPSFCPDILYEIMLQCWEEDPKKRPPFSRLVQDVTNVITTLQKRKRDKEVGLKVTYVNYPRTEGDEEDDDDDDEAGPSYQR